MAEAQTTKTKLGAKILEVLRTDSGWYSRREIALKLGRKRITPYDVQLLEVFVAEGLLEADERSIGVVMTERVYRAKPGQ